MSKFFVDVLAKAKIKGKNCNYTTEKIISTMLVVYGEVIKDVEQIDVYTRYEEFYEYDITEAEPFAKDEFYTINTKGERKDNESYEIVEILEVFEEDCVCVED